MLPWIKTAIQDDLLFHHLARSLIILILHDYYEGIKTHWEEYPGQDSPDRIKDVAVLEYPQQLVVGGDFVKMCAFFVGKEQIRLPDGVQHGRVKVKRVIWVLAVGQAWIVPLLPQEDVYSVILRA